MAINQADLTKGQIRKLNALRRSIGDTLAEEAFAKWLRQQEAELEYILVDPVAELLAETLAPLLKKKNLNLGRYGYCVKRARGKGAQGIVVSRIEKSE